MAERDTGAHVPALIADEPHAVHRVNGAASRRAWPTTGDRTFRGAFEERIRELNEEAGTVSLVGSDNTSVRDTCDRVLWLERGELRMDGPTVEVLDAYEKFTEK
ncbi:hypothetical protein Sm713_74650 [Streptomyces sp. TS71-3]|nr:hypothetical protein Sm713_74650 [Streptomyces sp. TS71-3]